MSDRPPDTAAILTAIRDWMTRYVIVDPNQADVLTVWAAHTWVIEAAEFTPYLHITAAEKECGKSRLLDTLEGIVWKPCKSEGNTPAALLRTIDRDSPTLLLDEIDATFGGNKEAVESIRGILNSGFKRGGIHRKCTGKNHDLKDFKTFGPKAFAGIGKVPDTVASRSITIELKRKRPDERVESLHYRDIESGQKSLVASIASWSKSGVAERLNSARPEFPDEFGDRQKDICEILLGIVDDAGPEWSHRVRHALVALFGSESAEDNSQGVTLLRDIRAVFESLAYSDTQAIFSADLVSALVALEGSPWGEWPGIKGFTANTLARLLKRFQIRPRTLRMGKSMQKGYLRADFHESWSRYARGVPKDDVSTVTAVTMGAESEEIVPEQPSHVPALTAAEVFGEQHVPWSVTADTAVTAPQRVGRTKRMVEGSV